MIWPKQTLSPRSSELTKDTNVSEASLVRPMHFDDVISVVTVHLAAFQGFFLTFLGRSFLTELYKAIIADSSGIAIVYERDGQIIGFVAGTTQASGFYRRILRQRWWRFGIASVVPMVRRPQIAFHLLRAFRLPQQTSTMADLGTLMSIAVSPVHQTHGAGKALVAQFLHEARSRGLKHVNLFTDRVNNEAANRFYQGLGFVCIRDYVTPEGRAMNEYLIDL